MRIKADQTTTRLINRRLILDCLRREGSMSRIGLVGRTGLSAAAISGVVGELKAEGFVVEGEASKSSGGRKPIPVSINHGFRTSIGLKLMHDRIDATLTDLGIAPLNSVSAPLSDRSPRTMVQAATEAVTTLMPDPKDRAERLLGIGVAMPGFIDAIRGICLRSDRFGWNDVPIAQMMASAIGKPVWADNDVNAYAIAQTLFGFGRMRRSVLVLILGTGVGAALMRDGKIDRGARFMAGEVGFTVEHSGKGGGRTWGELFAEPALEAEWERIVAARGQGGHVDLQAAAAAQDLDALGLLNDRGFRIGQHLAGLINLVDPEVIVVGGEAIRFGPEFVGPMQRAVREFSMVPAPHVDIDWKNDVWTRGAAALVIQSFFDFESVAGTQAGG